MGPMGVEKRYYTLLPPIELKKMKFLCLGVILALAVTLASAVSVSQLINDEWTLFKKTHTKSYSDFEDKFRLKVYLENRHKIARHNTRNQFGDVSYTLAMNKYGDLLHHELVAIMNGYKGKSGNKTSNFSHEGAFFVKPANVDPAGLSHRLALWKDNTSARLAKWCL